MAAFTFPAKWGSWLEIIFSQLLMDWTGSTLWVANAYTKEPSRLPLNWSRVVETKAKIGVFAIALGTYLPHFPSLVPEFESQYGAFKKTLPDSVELIDGGLERHIIKRSFFGRIVSFFAIAAAVYYSSMAEFSPSFLCLA